MFPNSTTICNILQYLPGKNYVLPRAECRSPPSDKNAWLSSASWHALQGKQFKQNFSMTAVCSCLCEIFSIKAITLSCVSRSTDYPFQATRRRTQPATTQKAMPACQQSDQVSKAFQSQGHWVSISSNTEKNTTSNNAKKHASSQIRSPKLFSHRAVRSVMHQSHHSAPRITIPCLPFQATRRRTQPATTQKTMPAVRSGLQSFFNHRAVRSVMHQSHHSAPRITMPCLPFQATRRRTQPATAQKTMPAVRSGLQRFFSHRAVKSVIHQSHHSAPRITIPCLPFQATRRRTQPATTQKTMPAVRSGLQSFFSHRAVRSVMHQSHHSALRITFHWVSISSNTEKNTTSNNAKKHASSQIRSPKLFSHRAVRSVMHQSHHSAPRITIPCLPFQATRRRTQPATTQKTMPAVRSGLQSFFSHRAVRSVMHQSHPSAPRITIPCLPFQATRRRTQPATTQQTMPAVRSGLQRFFSHRAVRSVMHQSHHSAPRITIPCLPFQATRGRTQPATTQKTMPAVRSGLQRFSVTGPSGL